MARVKIGLTAVTVLVASALAPLRAQQDPAQTLRNLLDSTDCDAASTEKAVRAVVEATAADALPTLLNGVERFADKLATSEVDVARTTKESELLQAAASPDQAAIEDKRVSGGKSQREAATRQGVLDAVVKGTRDLLDALAKKNSAASVPLLVKAYEDETLRLSAIEKKEEEEKGKLAKTSSHLYELEQEKAEADKIRPQALDKAGSAALVDRIDQTAEEHRSLRLKLAAVTGAVLQFAKGAEVDAALKSIEKKVDGKAPPEDRIPWIDLYARLGRENVPGELTSVAEEASKTLKHNEADLAKLRETYDKQKELFLKAVEQGNGTISVATKNAFDALQKQMTEASNQQHATERLRATASRAVGAAVASLPDAKREKAASPFLSAAKGEKDLETKCGLLESCGELDLPVVRETLRKLLVDEKEIKARLAALEALVTLKDVEMLDVVRARLLAHENWRVRAAAVAALVRVPQKESIGVLITALDGEVGRVREDITQALQRLTGQAFAMSAPVWKKWWDENQAKFRLEDVVKQKRQAVSAWEQEAQGKVTFYGITLVSKKVCFVLDVSNSMNDPASSKGGRKKIEVAKEQLKQAITGLSDGDQFAIIAFAESATRWQRGMTTVTAAVKEKVCSWIDQKLELGPGTNIHDGMKEAFTIAGLGAHDSHYDSAIDTIFFLSDGDATIGEVTDPMELRRLIREWNRLSRIRIHTIGVGEEPNIALLYGIAEDSGGQFQHR